MLRETVGKTIFKDKEICHGATEHDWGLSLKKETLKVLMMSS